jgi:hypothetical protein
MISSMLLIIVAASLMTSIASACNPPKNEKHEESQIEQILKCMFWKQLMITCPTNGAVTGIVVDVQGIFRGHIFNPNERWWILVKPMDSNLVHPGAPIDFSYCGDWGGTWKGRHSIYLTGDPNQAKQSFKVMVAKVTPKTHDLYVYRLANQIYDYIEMQPGTIIYDYIIVERLQ